MKKKSNQKLNKPQFDKLTALLFELLVLSLFIEVSLNIKGRKSFKFSILYMTTVIPEYILT